MKQLTKNQIQELFAFTKAHRIRYYDLQSEVVDHLASAIENKWEENPNLPFQKALDEVYTGFGIYGFGKLEQEKREAIRRKITRSVWTFVKAYLTIPKIGLTLLLITLLNFGLTLFPNPYYICYGITLLLFFVFAGLVYLEHRKNKKLVDKYLALNTIFLGEYPLLYLYIAPFEFFFFNDHSILPIWLLSTCSVLSTIAMIGTYRFMIEELETVKLRYERN